MIIQQRAEKKEDGTSQSNPFVLQPSINGKIDNDENPNQAIVREAGEELGKEFSQNFDFSSLKEFFTGEFIFKGEKFATHNYSGTITKAQLKKIRLHLAARKLLFLSKKDILMIKTIKDGGDPSIELVMFEDQLMVLRKLFFS